MVDLVEYTDEEILEWVESFKGEETRYTQVPDDPEYYNKWFRPETIKEEFGGDVMKAARSHPIYHTYYLLGFKLRPYQVYAMDRFVKKKYVLSIWGRRLGKSLEYKGFAHWAMHWNKYPQGIDKSTKVIVIAHTSDSAESYIGELKDFIEWGDDRVDKLFRGKHGEKYFSSRLPLKGTAKKNNNLIMDYKNESGSWSRIEVYPPTMKARGRPASIVIMDELAFWEEYTKDDMMIYKKVIRPIPTDQPDCKIFGATTPNGSRGMAYEMMDIDGHVTFYELIWFPFFYREEIEYYRSIREVYDEAVNTNDMDSFNQEYLAMLTSAKGAYFETEETDNVFDPQLRMVDTSTLKCRISLDFGGSKTSRTAMNVVTEENGLDKFGKKTTVVRRLYHKRYPVGQDSTLKNDLVDVTKRFPNFDKLYIDSQGGGSSFYSWARNKFGNRLEEVTFRGIKADMYRLFKIACFQGRIKSYFDRETMDEFNAFTADLKPSKGFTDDLLDVFVMGSKDWINEKQNNSFQAFKARNIKGVHTGWDPTKSMNLR